MFYPLCDDVLIEAYLFNDKSLNMLPTRGYTYPAAQQTVKVYAAAVQILSNKRKREDLPSFLTEKKRNIEPKSKQNYIQRESDIIQAAKILCKQLGFYKNKVGEEEKLIIEDAPNAMTHTLRRNQYLKLGRVVFDEFIHLRDEFRKIKRNNPSFILKE